jgi:hypothetical protein
MASKKTHLDPPTDSLIIRERRGEEHIDNCGSGYQEKSFCNIHHIVCVSALSDGTIAGFIKDASERKTVHLCLMITEWDINGAHNTVGMPLKQVYVDKAAPSGWNKIPCHQVDHNPYYTDAVKKRLYDQVWEPVAAAARECEFEATDLVSQLEDESDHWRKFLEDRGKKLGGTAYCWEHRGKMKKTWYLPFSMHPGKPTVRLPPPALKDFRGGMQAFIENIFKNIVK